MSETIGPTISILDLKDIPHLIDCVKRCYGDTYPNPIMYDEMLLKQAVQSKKLHSIVAKLGDDQIIGHCALTFSDNRNTAPEAGKMMVDPNYRGHHIAESIAKKRSEIAQSLGLAGFWTECVTNHPYSQHEMISMGAKETGLFIGDIPPSFEMQGIENHADTRMSLLVLYLSLKDHPHTIYIPSNHIDHVRDLVKSLGMDRKIESSTITGKDLTHFQTDIDNQDQTATISIHHIGADLIPIIREELIKAEAQNLATIYLDLPIEHEAASRAYEGLEDLGFFWGSWMPNYVVHKDILRLQKIYQNVNTSEIVCAREQGVIVKQYVISEWDRVLSKTQQSKL
jgi:RimJ/RimL family protein N-acetyltransferase